MYRIVLYELLFLVGAAVVLAVFGLLPYSPMSIILSATFITVICWVINKIFAKIFEAPSNPESTYITALILALIISPASGFADMGFFILAFWASALAVASKYILAIGKKHVFNPAAIAVVITAFALNQSASWWVGTAAMLPFVLVGGLLIVRKVQRTDLVWGFTMAALITTLVLSAMHGSNVVSTAQKIILSSPLIFFATIMLTEPLTSPPTIPLQMTYGIIVGILFAPAIHIGSIYSTPELALVVGNIFSYIVSPKKKLVLKLKEVRQISSDSYDFVFTPDKPLSFRPGQYMEWTLGHDKSDSRGLRRYFTLASSPTEKELRMGVKFYPDGSSFKKSLISMQAGDKIVATGLAGDFVLPKDKNEKLVFLAGGIGITPFRSMIQYLLDNGEKREVALLYSNKKISDVAYRETFDLAEKNLGIKTVYAATSPEENISSSPNFVRRIDEKTISEKVPDYRERIFYLSGPRGMVDAFDDTLRKMGVGKKQIKKDFFPGFV